MIFALLCVKFPELCGPEQLFRFDKKMPKTKVFLNDSDVKMSRFLLSSSIYNVKMTKTCP